MLFSLYMFIVVLAVVLALYPYAKGISWIQCHAKLHSILLAVFALGWAVCGMLQVSKNVPPFFTEERFEWIKTFSGGIASGLGLVIILSKSRGQAITKE